MLTSTASISECCLYFFFFSQTMLEKLNANNAIMKHAATPCAEYALGIQNS